MANANLIVEAIQQLLLKQSKMSKAELTAETLRTNELRRKAIQNRAAKSSAGKTELPAKQKGGEGPDSFDSLTEEGAQGFADPKFSLDESIAKELDEIDLGPTLGKKEKQELKRSGNRRIATRMTPAGYIIPGVANKEEMAIRAADKQKLYESTTGQQGKQDGRPYSVEDPAGEKMTLDKILESEVDESLASRANEAGRVSNQNQSVQNLRNKSQLDNLDRSGEEQELLDEAIRIRGAAKRSTNADIDQLGPTRLRKKIGVTAKNFGNKKELNADIQDMYSRLDEMFPGFKKGTPDSDVFFELDAKGKKIPGAKLQGGKDASMASRLNDTKKELANLAQRARAEDDPTILANIKRQLDEIDNEYFGTTSTQETRQLGNTINPESNVQSVKQFVGDDNVGESFIDFVDPRAGPDANVKLIDDIGRDVNINRSQNELTRQRLVGAQQGPSTGNKTFSQIRRPREFDPKNIGAPPTQSPLEARIQQMLMNSGK